MSEHLLMALVSVLALGIGAQWLGWRLKLPTILPLLVFGLVAGPVAAWAWGQKLVDPDDLMGELLFPIVSLSVGLILFEGALSLRFSELRAIGSALRNLLVIGAATTWTLAAASAHYILGFDWGPALLMGALLVVTGPTVIVPLLRQVRPTGSLASLLKWEGIVNDPVGAILAMLVMEVILAGSMGAGAAVALMLVKTVTVGLLGAGMSVGLLVIMLKRYWIPDFLQSPVTLALVAVAFTISNHLAAESGLLTVTVMGILLANQKWVTVHHIITFKENLRVLLIAALFILLAARLQPEEIGQLDWRSFAFLGALIVIVRPASVLLATWGSPLSAKERIFLALIAPRGIVAAAVTSILALRLLEHSDLAVQASRMAPNMFLVIIGTIMFCAITGGFAARALGLVSVNPQGVLFVGAHDWARQIALALQVEGFAVQMVDTNRSHIGKARLAGLPAYHGSILTEQADELLDLQGIRRMLAVTPNDEANALAAVHCSHAFGRGEVYQLVPDRGEGEAARTHRHLRGRHLFGTEINYSHFQSLFAAGAVVKTTGLTDSFSYEQFQEQYGEAVLPLFFIQENGGLMTITIKDPPAPIAGCKVVFLLDVEAHHKLAEQRRLDSQGSGAEK